MAGRAPYPPPGEQLVTAREFERMPEEHEYRMELVRGRLVRAPRPAPLHGRLTVRLARALEEWAEAGGHGVVLADVGVLLHKDPDTIRGPDLAFYTSARVPESAWGGGFWGPPGLAVKITSPANRASEIQAKIADYLDAGVVAVWIVDPPTHTVTAYRADGSARMMRGAAPLEDDVVPGFQLALATLFAV